MYSLNSGLAEFVTKIGIMLLLHTLVQPFNISTVVSGIPKGMSPELYVLPL